MNNEPEETPGSEDDQSSEEKRFWHVLWPLSPPPPVREDVKLLASVKMTSAQGWIWHVFLLGRPTETIDVIGASFPTSVMLSGIPYQQAASDALNRAFAAASMVYSSEIKLLEVSSGRFFSLGMYSDDELPTSYGVHIQMPERHPNWDLSSILNFVGAERISTEILGALSEATHESIPRHYRFLSLCRALELMIPEKRRRSEWLELYEDDFRSLNVDPKRFRNFVPELRNRCAHGDTGDERAIFGRVERGSVGVVMHGVATDVFNLLMRAVIERLSQSSGVQLKPPVIVDAELNPVARAEAGHAEQS